MESIHLEKQREVGRKDKIQSTRSSLRPTGWFHPQRTQFTRRNGLSLLLFLVIKAQRTSELGHCQDFFCTTAVDNVQAQLLT